MNGTLLLVELAGHVGLLLWGTHMVGTGVQRGFGPVLRRWLGRNLDSRWRAFLTGLGITTLLQSSTATGLLATSFTATGVIALAPAFGRDAGCQRRDGTPDAAALPQYGSRRPTAGAGGSTGVPVGRGRPRQECRAPWSLELVSCSWRWRAWCTPWVRWKMRRCSRPVIAALSSDPVLTVVLAALLTWACHSSIAIVLLVGTFAAGHVVGPTGALALVLGANIGGALPPLVSASTRAARRLPLGNLAVRFTECDADIAVPTDPLPAG